MVAIYWRVGFSDADGRILALSGLIVADFLSRLLVSRQFEAVLRDF